MNHYKAILLTTLLVFGLVIATIPKANAQASNLNTYSETRDLGWITTANSSGEIEIDNYTETSWGISGATFNTSFEFYLYHSWEINATTGTILPVNLTIIMPKEATPGESISIQIGIESLPGNVFFVLNGQQYLKTEIDFKHEMELSKEWNGEEESEFEHEFHFLLELLSQYSQSWNISLKTPIGYFNETFNDVVMHLGNFSLNSELSYEFDNETETEAELELNTNVSVDMKFDVEIIANTSVIGNVNLTGSALEGEQQYELVWNEEGLKSIEVPISPNATVGSGVNVSVGLEYIVHEFKIIYRNISLEINVNEAEFEHDFEQEFDEDMQNTTLYDNQTMNNYYNIIKQEMMNKIMMFLQKYAFTGWMLPFNVTKSVPIDHEHKHPLSSEDSNTIESSSPVESFVLAMSTAIISIVSEQPGGGGINIQIPSFMQGLNGLIIISSVIATIIVIGYVASRRNHS